MAAYHYWQLLSKNLKIKKKRQTEQIYNLYTMFSMFTWLQVSFHLPCCHPSISHVFSNYIILALYNTRVSGYFHITHTDKHTHACNCNGAAGDSSTSPWRLKASMPGVLPRFFFWVTDPPHAHMLFKFKEDNIRGRRERPAWVSTRWMQSHGPSTVYCRSDRTSHTSTFCDHSSKLIVMWRLRAACLVSVRFSSLDWFLWTCFLQATGREMCKWIR